MHPSFSLPKNTSNLLAEETGNIGKLVAAGPSPGLRQAAKNILDKILAGIPVPQLPDHLKIAPDTEPSQYHANWNHQLWYHLGELTRIHEGRRERAAEQGGDSWAHEPVPAQEKELGNHLRELAKLVCLLDQTPCLTPCEAESVLFEDALLDKISAWDIPAGLATERDPQKGTRWKGHKPGGHWFWLKHALPAMPLSFRCESNALPEGGGLILAFCARPREPGITFAMTSTPRMSDYYKNFHAYHFSVTRGASGYSNLRRCGNGLIMLASFIDPCPAPDEWHAMEIVKNGPQIDLRVDGKLSASYLDYGHIQPALDGGFFGIRHFGGLNAWHRNIRISAF